METIHVQGPKTPIGRSYPSDSHDPGRPAVGVGAQAVLDLGQRRAQVEGDGAGLAVADEPPALTRPLEVLAAPPVHWMLVGSLLVDLRRIHDSLAARAEE